MEDMMILYRKSMEGTHTI